MTLNSQTAVNALLSVSFYANRYCLSSVAGTSTTSFYNTTSGAGTATASNATNTLVVYFCNQMFVFGNNAQIIQAVAASLLAAASMLYIA